MERANNDLLVFMVLAAAAWVISKFERREIWASVGLIGLAAALKIYPVAALAGIPAARSPFRAIVAAGLGAVAACVIVATFAYADYARALSMAPQHHAFFTYGFTSFGMLTRYAFQWQVVVGVAAAFTLSGVLVGARWRELWNVVPLHGGTAFAYIAGAGCWVFCYSVTSNYAYRAVLLLLPARLWLRNWENENLGGICRRCSWLVLALLWTGVVTGNVRCWQETYTGRWADVLLIIGAMEQTLTLVVTALLLTSLLGWATRHWQVKSTSDLSGSREDAKLAK